MDTGEIVPVSLQIPNLWIEEERPRHRRAAGDVTGCFERELLEQQFMPGMIPCEDIPSTSQYDSWNSLMKRFQE